MHAARAGENKSVPHRLRVLIAVSNMANTITSIVVIAKR
jgi:hypothetical protein